MFLNIFKQTHRALQFNLKANFSNVSVKMIKELRDLTGSSIDECRRALEAQNCDLEKARDHLRKRGLSQAEKKSGRQTLQGVMGVKLNSSHRYAAVAEVNCETDFVAKTDLFLNFVESVLTGAVHDSTFDTKEITEQEEIEKHLQRTEGGKIMFADEEVNSLHDAKKLAISKLQENIIVGALYRFQRSDDIKGLLGYYVHNNNMRENIGSAVSLVDAVFEHPLGPDNRETAQEIINHLAMQLLATKPTYITKEDVPEHLLRAEMEKVRADLGDTLKGKPERVIHQIIEGKMKKFYEDNVFMEQQYVLDPTESSSVITYNIFEKVT